jgi:hypothetical protein
MGRAKTEQPDPPLCGHLLDRLFMIVDRDDVVADRAFEAMVVGSNLTFGWWHALPIPGVIIPTHAPVVDTAILPISPKDARHTRDVFRRIEPTMIGTRGTFRVSHSRHSGNA